MRFWVASAHFQQNLPWLCCNPPGKNIGTFLERAARVNGAWDWNYLINVSAEQQSGVRGSFLHSLKHLSHVQHSNEQKIQSREVWVTSHFSTTLPFRHCAVWMLGVCLRVCAPTCSLACASVLSSVALWHSCVSVCVAASGPSVGLC